MSSAMVLLSTLYRLDAETWTYHTITTPEFDHAVRAVGTHYAKKSYVICNPP
jgi:hypothetical protein